MPSEQISEPSPIDIVNEFVENIEYDVLLFDGFESAIIGMSAHRMDEPVRVVYDCAKMVDVLMTRDGMSREEAEEFVERSAMATWVGKPTPIIMTPLSYIDGA